MSNLSKIRGYLQIHRFEEETSICPVQTLEDYLYKVKWSINVEKHKPNYFQVLPHRNAESLFLSLVAPHKPVSAATLARWLANYLALAGVDTAIFKPHSTRSASAAFLKSEKKMSVKKICEIANWSNVSSVYQKFYERYF